ncbi:MAG: hypothetical protein R2853_19075 [Thermomicrobiales bacterium]
MARFAELAGLLGDLATPEPSRQAAFAERVEAFSRSPEKPT